jgi:hypothetical protein
MRLRHVAALALTGWYLMVPPPGDWITMNWFVSQTKKAEETGQPLGDMSWVKLAPLSGWDTVEVFDSAGGCQKILERVKKQFDPVPSRDINGGTYDQYKGRFAECIATDDPRLKEK